MAIQSMQKVTQRKTNTEGKKTEVKTPCLEFHCERVIRVCNAIDMTWRSESTCMCNKMARWDWSGQRFTWSNEAILCFSDPGLFVYCCDLSSTAVGLVQVIPSEVCIPRLPNVHIGSLVVLQTSVTLQDVRFVMVATPFAAGLPHVVHFTFRNILIIAEQDVMHLCVMFPMQNATFLFLTRVWISSSSSLCCPRFILRSKSPESFCKMQHEEPGFLVSTGFKSGQKTLLWKANCSSWTQSQLFYLISALVCLCETQNAILAPLWRRPWRERFQSQWNPNHFIQARRTLSWDTPRKSLKVLTNLGFTSGENLVTLWGSLETSFATLAGKDCGSLAKPLIWCHNTKWTCAEKMLADPRANNEEGTFL